MIKKVTIITGNTGKYVCPMEEEALARFMRQVNEQDNQLISVADYMPEGTRDNAELYIKSEKIEGILVEAVSNIAVPKRQIVIPGGKPAG